MIIIVIIIRCSIEVLVNFVILSCLT